MLDWQEPKKLAIYKHDLSPRGIILKAVYCKGNKKGSVADLDLQIRREWVGGSKNKGEPPGPYPGSVTGVSLSRGLVS